MNTALKIFAQGGGDALSLNRLADEAGVAHGTVYNHFRTKEELLEGLGIALVEEFSHEIAAASAGLSRGAERVSAGVRSFVCKAQANPELGTSLIKVIRHAEGLRSTLTAYIRRDLQEGVSQGDFRIASEEMAIAMVVAGTTGIISTLVEGNVVDTPDTVAAEMILLALGMSADQAQQIAARPLLSFDE